MLSFILFKVPVLEKKRHFLHKKKAFLPKMGSKKVIKHKKHHMLVHFSFKYYNCHSVMPLKYFRYHATDSEVLILMSNGGNPNVYLSTRISPESEFLSFISFDKILH